MASLPFLIYNNHPGGFPRTPLQIASSEPSGHRPLHTHMVSLSIPFNLGVPCFHSGQRLRGVCGMSPKPCANRTSRLRSLGLLIPTLGSPRRKSGLEWFVLGYSYLVPSAAPIAWHQVASGNSLAILMSNAVCNVLKRQFWMKGHDHLMTGNFMGR